MKSNELQLLENLIKEKEEVFQRALTNNAESGLLTYMKKDIDLFREKRAELFRKLKKEK